MSDAQSYRYTDEEAVLREEVELWIDCHRYLIEWAIEDLPKKSDNFQDMVRMITTKEIKRLSELEEDVRSLVKSLPSKRLYFALYKFFNEESLEREDHVNNLVNLSELL